jgi:hypothetical protein
VSKRRDASYRSGRAGAGLRSRLRLGAKRLFELAGSSPIEKGAATPMAFGAIRVRRGGAMISSQ